MRVGVFGGAFDPVHVGHLLAAQDVREKLALDRVIFVLSAQPPHKSCVLPYEQRRRLLKAALHGYSGFELSDVEFGQAGLTYTIETLARLRELHPRDRLFLMIGADQYRSLNTWKEPTGLMRYAQLVVMNRPGTEAKPGRVPAKLVPVRQIEVSSTEIRRRIGQSRSVENMVPEASLRLIRRNRLYEKPNQAGGKHRPKGSK